MSIIEKEQKKYKKNNKKKIKKINNCKTSKTNKNNKNSYIENYNANIKEIAVKFRTELISRITTSEKLFRRFLDRNGYTYDFQKIIYLHENTTDSKITKFYIADFYIKSLHLIVEIDGGYHTTNEQINYDSNKDFRIKKQYPTIHILRIKNEICNNEKYIKDLLDSYKDDFEL